MAAKMLMMMMMLIAAAILMGCINLAVATYNYDGEPTKPIGSIHVFGDVWCQDCSKSYNKFAEGDRPLKGVKVSLTCMDKRKRVMHYKSDLTDEKGHYEMEVERYVYGKEIEAGSCSVRLVLSPDPTCNVLTNFAGGKLGVKLLRPTEEFGDTFFKYKLGRFFFTTPMCEKPDTSAHSNEYDQPQYNNYQPNNY